MSGDGTGTGTGQPGLDDKQNQPAQYENDVNNDLEIGVPGEAKWLNNGCGAERDDDEDEQDNTGVKGASELLCAGATGFCGRLRSGLGERRFVPGAVCRRQEAPGDETISACGLVIPNERAQTRRRPRRGPSRPRRVVQRLLNSRVTSPVCI